MLRTAAEVSQMILAGRKLVLAGEEAMLSGLPSGDWIAGTIPYFMTEEGGQTNSSGIFVTELPPEVTQIRIVAHGAGTLSVIAEEAPENGFTFLILPAGSDVHMDYAREAPDYPHMFLRPIVGWISGVRLADLGRALPKVFDGRTGLAYPDRAVAMHCTLAEGVVAQLGIVNLFKQGDGDTITFPDSGFRATECWINGKRCSFPDYLTKRRIDTRLPLVANYSGTMINVSIQEVDPAAGHVKFYGPVFEGVAYRVAAPVGDYVQEFHRAIPAGIVPVFSCNCILNYLYSELEGKVTTGMSGPITFGEIAYQLLNQTLVYLTIETHVTA
jgi:hypothetical protein